MEVTEDQSTLEQLAAAADQLETEEVALALAAALQLGYERQVQAGLQAASEALSAGATADEALGAMRMHLTVDFLGLVRPQVRQASRMLYEIGQRQVGASGIGQAGQEVIEFTEQNSAFWIRNHYDRFLTDRIRSIGAENFREGVGAFRSGRQFAQSSLGQQFGKSQSYWELLSNAVATRTRELSHIDGFAKVGADEAQIDAVLDRRTSCICRTLDGTSFPVEVLQQYRDQMVGSGPEEIKQEVSPWLSCERVRSLEAQGVEALAEAGVVAPPFHGHCRSSLIRPIN